MVAEMDYRSLSFVVAFTPFSLASWQEDFIWPWREKIRILLEVIGESRTGRYDDVILLIRG